MKVLTLKISPGRWGKPTPLGFGGFSSLQLGRGLSTLRAQRLKILNLYTLEVFNLDLAEALATYRIEKPQKIGEKYRGNRSDNPIFCLFLVYFSPVFCLFFSNFPDFGVFLFCRWPRLLQILTFRIPYARWGPIPKDPAVLKILRRMNSLSP